MDGRTETALAVTIVLWASAFVGIRAGLEAYSPGRLALLRFLVASVTLAMYVAMNRVHRPARKDLFIITLTGFFGVTLYHVLLNAGEVTVTAGTASFIVNSVPVFTA